METFFAEMEEHNRRARSYVWSRTLTILVLAIIALGLTCASSAGAGEIESGTGLICDSKEQVEQFLKLQNSGTSSEAAIEEINGDTNACAIASVAYARVETAGSARSRQGMVNIVLITIVAVHNGAFWVRGPPFAQYTMFLSKEEGI